PTPRGGGLAVWFGVLSVFGLGYLALWYVAESDLAENLVPQFARSHVAGIWARSGKLWTLLAAGTALMLLGLGDDLRGLSWQFRLLTEFVIAALCVWLVPNLRLAAFVPLPLLTEALSVLWIVALINAFNMLDNMDGLSAGVAAIAGSMLAAVMLLAPNPKSNQPQLFVAGLLFVLVGALLGFLFHNRPPAKIFMGD